MKTIGYWMSAAVLLLATLGGGILYGNLTNRWGPRPDATLAKNRLREPLPQRIGDWRLVRDVPLEPEVVRTLKCSAYISQVYEHEESGDVVSVAVLLGPSGSISVHTPEICYSGADYTVDGQRQKTFIKDQSGVEHSLWEIAVQSNRLIRPPMRVMYAWNAGSGWDATDHPRYRFGGLPHLYKIQIAGSIRNERGNGSFDPSVDFLSQFLAEIESHLLNPSAAPVARPSPQ